MKKYEFRLVVEDGCDEFWEEEPKPEELARYIADDLECHGWGVKLKFLGMQDENGQTQLELEVR